MSRMKPVTNGLQAVALYDRSIGEGLSLPILEPGQERRLHSLQAVGTIFHERFEKEHEARELLRQVHEDKPHGTLIALANAAWREKMLCHSVVFHFLGHLKMGGRSIREMMDHIAEFHLGIPPMHFDLRPEVEFDPTYDGPTLFFDFDGPIRSGFFRTKIGTYKEDGWATRERNAYRRKLFVTLADMSDRINTDNGYQMILTTSQAAAIPGEADYEERTLTQILQRSGLLRVPGEPESEYSLDRYFHAFCSVPGVSFFRHHDDDPGQYVCQPDHMGKIYTGIIQGLGLDHHRIIAITDQWTDRSAEATEQVSTIVIPQETEPSTLAKLVRMLEFIALETEGSPDVLAVTRQICGIQPSYYWQSEDVTAAYESKNSLDLGGAKLYSHMLRGFADPLLTFDLTPNTLYLSEIKPRNVKTVMRGR